MELLDTQIISYRFKGATAFYDKSVQNGYISSITALEFLQVFDKEKLNSARYYLPVLGTRHPELTHFFIQNMGNGVSKSRTDSIVVDMGGKYDSFAVYSNRAISNLLNTRNKNGILWATGQLDKTEQKKIAKRVDFLLDENIQVIPVNPWIMDEMLDLMALLEGRYNFKNDYRNSVMDLLIAATAIHKNAKLITLDKELNRAMITARQFEHKRLNERVVEIDMKQKDLPDSEHGNRGSKGYINQGWHYAFRNGKL